MFRGKVMNMKKPDMQTAFARGALARAVALILAMSLVFVTAACPKSMGDTAGVGAQSGQDVGVPSQGGDVASQPDADSSPVEAGDEAAKADSDFEDSISAKEDEKPMKKDDGWRPLKLTSPAFNSGGMIPAKYTGDGMDISPPLFISGVPEEAKSLVLIMDDPDAPGGVWDHWILFNIPVNTTTIKEGTTPPGARKGNNSWGGAGYGGPAPPSGTHHYRFKLYALDSVIGLDAGATKAQVERDMAGHVVADTMLEGLYARKK